MCDLDLISIAEKAVRSFSREYRSPVNDDDLIGEALLRMSGCLAKSDDHCNEGYLVQCAKRGVQDAIRKEAVYRRHLAEYTEAAANG